MSPFRALTLSMAIILVLAALAAYLLGVPAWAVVAGTLVAACAAVVVIGWVTRRGKTREKAGG